MHGRVKVYRAPLILVSIAVTTLPKTTYSVGERLDLSGMEVVGLYNDGITRPIVNYTTIPANGTILTGDITSVVVAYENVTTNFQITVEAPRTITITGSGNESYCYATINGTKVYSSGTYNVNRGTEITLGVYGRSSSYYGSVTVNGTVILKVADATTKTTTYTVNSNITISMSYTSSTLRRNGKITITTT